VTGSPRSATWPPSSGSLLIENKSNFERVSAGEIEVFQGPPPAQSFDGCQLALPVCHGRWGEDGTLQGLLACYGLPVVGCGVAASAVCMDKHLTRSVLGSAGLPVARGVRIGQRDHVTDPGRVVDLVRDRVGPGPWFVKPACGGSSLGIGRADAPAGLYNALAESFRWSDAALVQEAIPHRELVLGITSRAALHAALASSQLPEEHRPSVLD